MVFDGDAHKISINLTACLAVSMFSGRQEVFMATAFIILLFFFTGLSMI